MMDKQEISIDVMEDSVRNSPADLHDRFGLKLNLLKVKFFIKKALKIQLRE